MPNDSDVFNNIELSSNLFRPYTVQQTAQPQTIANIILYSNAKSITSPNANPIGFDFYSSFNKYIEALIPNPNINTDIDVTDGKPWQGTLDGVNQFYGVFNNFCLSSVTEMSDQIIKLHQNFGGSWNAFFFGKKPQIYTFSGYFLDSKEYPYYQEFMTAYEKYLAGRKCIENNISMKIMYDAKIVSGYMINITTTLSSQTSLIKNFQFTVLITGDPQWLRSNYIYTALSDGSVSMEEQANQLSNAARTSKAFSPLLVNKNAQ